MSSQADILRFYQSKVVLRRVKTMDHFAKHFSTPFQYLYTLVPKYSSQHIILGYFYVPVFFRQKEKVLHPNKTPEDSNYYSKVQLTIYFIF